MNFYKVLSPRGIINMKTQLKQKEISINLFEIKKVKT